MRCPRCGGNTKVVGSRSDCKYVYRYRVCLECDNHDIFTTEFIDEESHIAYNKAMKFVREKPGRVTTENITFRDRIEKVKEVEPKAKAKDEKLIPKNPLLIEIDRFTWKCCPACFFKDGTKTPIGLGQTVCKKCGQRIKPL